MASLILTAVIVSVKLEFRKKDEVGPYEIGEKGIAKGYEKITENN